MEKNVLITAKEAAEILGVHVNTIRSMAEDGRLKGTKTGEKGHWRFLKSDIDAFIKNKSENGIQSVLDNAIYILDDIPEKLKINGVANTIWETINKHFGIRAVFGSHAINAEMHDYIDIINRKSFKWIGEGFCNFLQEHKSIKDKNKYAINYSKIVLSENVETAFGVVKFPAMFDMYSYCTVSLLVVNDNEGNKWVVDGTLQQFYKNMRKGLVVLPYDKAKELYLSLETYSREDFVELFSDDNISEKFIEKAKKIEKEKNKSTI